MDIITHIITHQLLIKTDGHYYSKLGNFENNSAVTK